MSERAQFAGHAFISYVREDSGDVDQLQQMLEAAGVQVWRDTADLWPGEDWRAKIRRAITDDALVFIACFSHNSLARKVSYQNEEMALAIDQLRLRRPGKPWLIPVRFDDCDIPDFDIGGGRTLATIQRADVFGDRKGDGIVRLVAAVRRILRQSSAPQTTSGARPCPTTRPSRPPIVSAPNNGWAQTAGKREPLEISGDGTVLFDTGHNSAGWDRGPLPRLDADYQLLAKAAGCDDGLVRELNLRDFSLDFLGSAKLLVLVNPKDCHYSKAEIEHLVQFTHSGGSLLILAYYWWKSDHDSTVGDLTAEFGIQLRDDRIYDANHYSDNEYRPLSECLKSELTVKPVACPFTCSMTIDHRAEPVLVASSSACSEIVQFVDRRIVRRSMQADAEELIAAAQSSINGGGRVFVAGSWEMFLDQAMTRSELGNYELLKGILAWLQKK